MKKINGIHAISAQEQLTIVYWYTITKKILYATIVILATLTITRVYLQKYYLRTCSPCISPAYAETIAKKHAAQTTCMRKQKQKDTELQQSSALISNYATIINLHTEPSTTAQLTDLQLSPQSIIAHYVIANRTAIQTCLERLTASPVIKQASFESIEQKTNLCTCVIKATWQK